MCGIAYSGHLRRLIFRLDVVTPSDHLRAWFTPARRKLISSRALDELANRYPGTFSRFLAGEASYVLTRGNGLKDYYPVLRLLGYHPPKEGDTRQNRERST